MIQELYQKAMKFAGEKHAEQKVPGSKSNYLLHLSNVAMEVLFAHKKKEDFDLECAIQLAILHDTVEDTDTTAEELSELFGTNISNGVLALTKNTSIASKDDQMTDSLTRINLLRKEVGIVKIADRITNLQKPPPHWTNSKTQSYHQQAIIIANKLHGKNEYLENRLKGKIEAYKNHFQ
ncbi:MAG: HD domain-containing protein [Saprospiraceae bacterium]